MDTSDSQPAATATETRTNSHDDMEEDGMEEAYDDDDDDDDNGALKDGTRDELAAKDGPSGPSGTSGCPSVGPVQKKVTKKKAATFAEELETPLKTKEPVQENTQTTPTFHNPANYETQKLPDSLPMMKNDYSVRQNLFERRWHAGFENTQALEEAFWKALPVMRARVKDTVRTIGKGPDPEELAALQEMEAEEAEKKPAAKETTAPTAMETEEEIPPDYMPTLKEFADIIHDAFKKTTAKGKWPKEDAKMIVRALTAKAAYTPPTRIPEVCQGTTVLMSPVGVFYYVVLNHYGKLYEAATGETAPPQEDAKEGGLLPASQYAAFIPPDPKKQPRTPKSAPIEDHEYEKYLLEGRHETLKWKTIIDVQAPGVTSKNVSRLFHNIRRGLYQADPMARLMQFESKDREEQGPPMNTPGLPPPPPSEVGLGEEEVEEVPFGKIRTYLNKLTFYKNQQQGDQEEETEKPRTKWFSIYVLHEVDAKDLVQALNARTPTLVQQVYVATDKCVFKMANLQEEHLEPVCHVLGIVAASADKQYYLEAFVAWLTYREPYILWEEAVELRVEYIANKSWEGKLSPQETRQKKLRDELYDIKKLGDRWINPKQALTVWVTKRYAAQAAVHLGSMLHPSKVSQRPGMFYAIPLFNKKYFVPSDEEPEWKEYARERTLQHMQYMNSQVVGTATFARHFEAPLAGQYMTLRAIMMMARSTQEGKGHCCLFNQVDLDRSDTTGKTITFTCHVKELQVCHAWIHYLPVMIERAFHYEWGYSIINRALGDRMRENTYYKPDSDPNKPGKWYSKDDKERLNLALNVAIKTSDGAKTNVRTLFAAQFLQVKNIPDSQSVSTQVSAVSEAPGDFAAARATAHDEDASTINTAPSHTSKDPRLITNNAVVIQDIPRHVRPSSRKYVEADDDMSAISAVSGDEDPDDEEEPTENRTRSSTHSVNEGVAGLQVSTPAGLQEGEYQEVLITKPPMTEPEDQGFYPLTYDERRSYDKYQPGLHDLATFYGIMGNVRTEVAQGELMMKLTTTIQDAHDLELAVGPYSDRPEQLYLFNLVAGNLNDIMYQSEEGVHKTTSGETIDWKHWTQALYRTFINVRIFRGVNPSKYKKVFDPPEFAANLVKYAMHEHLHPYQLEAYLFMANYHDIDEASITFRIKQRKTYQPMLQRLFDRANMDPDSMVTWDDLQQYCPVDLPDLEDPETKERVMSERAYLHENLDILRDYIKDMPQGYWKSSQGKKYTTAHASLQKILYLMGFHYLRLPKEYCHMLMELTKQKTKDGDYTSQILTFGTWLERYFNRPLNEAIENMREDKPPSTPATRPPAAPNPNQPRQTQGSRKRPAQPNESPHTAASSKRAAGDRE